MCRLNIPNFGLFIYRVKQISIIARFYFNLRNFILITWKCNKSGYIEQSIRVWLKIVEGHIWPIFKLSSKFGVFYTLQSYLIKMSYKNRPIIHFFLFSKYIWIFAKTWQRLIVLLYIFLLLTYIIQYCNVIPYYFFDKSHIFFNSFLGHFFSTSTNSNNIFDINVFI